VFLAESYFIKSIEEKEERDKCTLIEKGMLMFEKKLGESQLGYCYSCPD
jgi:hypothetical protein